MDETKAYNRRAWSAFIVGAMVALASFLIIGPTPDRTEQEVTFFALMFLCGVAVMAMAILELVSLNLSPWAERKLKEMQAKRNNMKHPPN